MSELVMTKTANLRLGGIAGWGGSQRCEDDTTIRADRSIHQDSPKGIVFFHFVFAWTRGLGELIRVSPR
jgi:hypothetical protein